MVTPMLHMRILYDYITRYSIYLCIEINVNIIKNIKSKKKKKMKFLVLISICYARPNSNEKTLEKSNCKNIIQVSDTTEESHVDYKIGHFPKFYRFNFNFKINSLNLDAPTRFTHGLRNILHSSTVSDTNSHCSQHQAGRLPSLFAYINHQSEFEYLYVELCVGHELQTMFIKPKDFSFEMGKWNSFNIEQTMSKTIFESPHNHESSHCPS